MKQLHLDALTVKNMIERNPSFSRKDKLFVKQVIDDLLEMLLTGVAIPIKETKTSLSKFFQGSHHELSEV